MKDTVREWIEKAEADLETASREVAVTKRPNCDAVCYHAQQCVEKLLKGLAISYGVVPPKTHDLKDLARLLEPVTGLKFSTHEMNMLTQGSVTFRYPGDTADAEEAKEYYGTAARLWQEIRPLLDRPDEKP